MKNIRITWMLLRQWLAPILACISIYPFVTLAQTENNNVITDLATDEERMKAVKRSAFILAMCGVVFGLLNLICCSISLHKAIRDRKAIITRNAARRKAKEFAGEDHRLVLLADQHKPPITEPKLTSVVYQVMNEHMIPDSVTNPSNENVTYRTSQSYLQPQDPVTHHFSRSPKLLRAKISADVHDNDGTNDNRESHHSSSGTYSRLSAYPRTTLPPLASYNNL